jgi:putative peptidoglycan lipid II flippase
MSVAAAELPEMSRMTDLSDDGRKRLGARIAASQKRIAFFVVPSVLAFVFVGSEIVGALYQTGQFTHDDTLFVWYVLMGSSVGLLASTWGRLFSSAFYAIQDTRTPLKFAIVRVVLTGALGWLFAFVLRAQILYVLFQVIGFHRPNIVDVETGLGALGLTLSAGLAGWVEFLLLRFSLRRKLGPIEVEKWYMLKVWSSALFASGAICLIKMHDWIFDLRHDARMLFGYNFVPLYTIAIYGMFYLLACWMFRLELPIRRK